MCLMCSVQLVKTSPSYLTLVQPPVAELRSFPDRQTSCISTTFADAKCRRGTCSENYEGTEDGSTVCTGVEVERR